MFSIRPWLFLGKYSETNNLLLLQFHKIEAMLQFGGRVEYPVLQTLYLPIEDGIPLTPTVLQQGLNFILAEHRQQKNVLVSCGAGISRSVTFTLAALRETENISLLNAYRVVQAVHPGALPHPALWQSLCAFYQEETPYWLLLKTYNGRTS